MSGKNHVKITKDFILMKLNFHSKNCAHSITLFRDKAILINKINMKLNKHKLSKIKKIVPHFKSREQIKNKILD
ncbi:hypothetical protein BpHYR1_030568 [Brachionus plicatilis]|uniref:Uncharacterized protein n=1 Tax=Brachionus plicatilis TaxID=10195 RepID=A0A3M7SRN1_BRAPC|nr:hypothetical protein BpHYR1_030568 [Brachionus plicatilis]